MTDQPQSSDDREAQDKKALARYLIISALRLIGAILIAMGLAIIANGWMDLPILVGYILFAIGVYDFIAVPVILSRKWKSPPEK
jgi:hypothetical protein